MTDLFTGCFEGGVYLLRGREDRGFDAPAKLLDRAGRTLRLGQYWDYEGEKWTGVEGGEFASELGIGAAAVDWDGDQDLDLLLGSYAGGLYLRVNEGTKSSPEFAIESVRIAADGQPLQVPGADAIPAIADWDGDGRFDVLSGSGEGGAYWFRNVGEAGSPRLEPARELVAKASGSGGTLADPAWPGKRTQACAADFDGDGDLDLLVGDYHSGEWKDGVQPEMHGFVWLFRRERPAAGAAGTR